MNKQMMTLMGLMFCTIISFAQAKTNVKKKKVERNSAIWELTHHKDSYDDCVFSSKYSPRQRLAKYPFNKAVKILAVSYKLADNSPRAEIRMDDSTTQKNLDTIAVGGLQIHNNILDSSDLIEKIELNTDQINDLTNLIFNAKWRIYYNIHGEIHGACFYPRNAIVFIDADNKVIDYIEICFQCLNIHSMNDDRHSIGTLCNQKYDLMKKWFISAGITYGTIKTDKDD